MMRDAHISKNAVGKPRIMTALEAAGQKEEHRGCVALLKVRQDRQRSEPLSFESVADEIPYKCIDFCG